MLHAATLLAAAGRSVAMMVPDYALISEISLYSSGYLKARDLARKLVATYRCAGTTEESAHCVVRVMRCARGACSGMQAAVSTSRKACTAAAGPRARQANMRQA